MVWGEEKETSQGSSRNKAKFKDVRPAEANCTGWENIEMKGKGNKTRPTKLWEATAASHQQKLRRNW